MWAFVSTDKAAEMAYANRFFYFILECFALICVMAIVFVVTTVLGHVCVGRVRCFPRWWDEVGMEGFVKKAGSRTLSDAYLVKRGCLGSLGLESGHGGGLSGVVVEGV